MIGIGIDTVDRCRIARDVEAWGTVFARRVLTVAERSTWRDDNPVIVGAAIVLKEAAYKACGPFDHYVGWHGVTILRGLDRAAVTPLFGRVVGVVTSAMDAEIAGYVRCAVPSAGVLADAAWAIASGDIVAVAIGSP